MVLQEILKKSRCRSGTKAKKPATKVSQLWDAFLMDQYFLHEFSLSWKIVSWIDWWQFLGLNASGINWHFYQCLSVWKSVPSTTIKVNTGCEPTIPSTLFRSTFLRILSLLTSYRAWTCWMPFVQGRKILARMMIKYVGWWLWQIALIERFSSSWLLHNGHFWKVCVQCTKS